MPYTFGSLAATVEVWAPSGGGPARRLQTRPGQRPARRQMSDNAGGPTDGQTGDSDQTQPGPASGPGPGPQGAYPPYGEQPPPQYGQQPPQYGQQPPAYGQQPPPPYGQPPPPYGQQPPYGQP